MVSIGRRKKEIYLYSDIIDSYLSISRHLKIWGSNWNSFTFFNSRLHNVLEIDKNSAN